MPDKIVGKKVRIDRSYPEFLESHFVSNLVVQHQPDHFILSFFEVWPPPIIGETDAEKQQVIEAIDHIDATCVSRLVVTPDRMKEFVQLLSESLTKYEQMMRIQSDLAEE